MNTWFLTKIRYEKVMENGMQKKVTEPYLVDALSFTEAEARIIEEVTPFISGEFTVSDISRAHYSEIFTSEEDSAVLSWHTSHGKSTENLPNILFPADSTIGTPHLVRNTHA